MKITFTEKKMSDEQYKRFVEGCAAFMGRQLKQIKKEEEERKESNEKDN